MTSARATSDTIVAVATPAGRGAVGMLRLSGSDVPRIAVDLLGSLPAPRTARLMRFLDEDGTSLDQGLVLLFPAPASFTGEDVLELQGHGGPLVMAMLLQRLLALGCRMARPGEFSERAFLNGKMDVAQAEAVADLIDAGSTAAARAAVRSMQGDFSSRIQAVQMQLTELRVIVEALIDFPDEEVDLFSDSAWIQRLSNVFDAFDAIEAAARQGTLLRDGMTVVIAGRPNAGKSSIMNRLVGNEIAIVTNMPGTTRDVLRQHVELDGLPLNLVDTAGLRTAGDVAEEEGIRRARLEMRNADRVLLVVDATEGVGGPIAELLDLPPEIPVTVLINKIDLIGASPTQHSEAGSTRIFVSARSGDGLDLVRRHLKESVGYQEADSGTLSARQRHRDALTRARSWVQCAADNHGKNRPPELVAEDLRLAQNALSEITGELTSDDLLGAIFSTFCIGK